MTSLAPIIEALNAPQLQWRNLPRGASAPGKEWYHFCVIAPGLELIINFSLEADLRPAATQASVSRLIVLARTQGWHGAVETFSPGEVSGSPTDVHLELGPHRLRFEDGVFHLAIRPQEGGLSAVLRLEPLAMPLRSQGATLGDGSLSWVVVPALRARGSVRVGDRLFRLDGAPAYHDHNWGTWRWGSDFAWQWGFGLPAGGSPWSLVFSRMTNRARTRELDRKLCLWRDGRLVRLFTERDVEVRPEGYLRREHVWKVPAIMALLSPGDALDVPRTLHVTARSGQDHLTLRFDADDVAQIVIPNETDLGVTLISEVCGRLALRGCVQGEPLTAEGAGVFEHVHPG